MSSEAASGPAEPVAEATEALTARLTFADVRFEEGSCPLCGALTRGPTVLEGRDDTWQKEGRFTLVPCAACGLIYTCPRPTEDTMRYYYEDCYSGEKKEEMRKAATDSPVSLFTSWMRLRTLEKARRLQPGDVVLDVGCSYGAFIEGVRKVRGIEAWAIDLDPGTIDDFINPVDVKVVCGDLRAQQWPDDTFDVITLFETLEHVYDPVGLLQEVHRLLKPGGIVSVEVPSWDGWPRRVFGSWWLPLLLPTHLQHFSMEHLGRCVGQAGLETVHHQSMFFPAENTLSLWVGLGRWLGRVPEGDKTFGRKLIEGVFGLWLVWVFIFVDIPVTALLSLFNRTGHQTILARKPVAAASGAPPARPQPEIAP